MLYDVLKFCMPTISSFSIYSLTDRRPVSKEDELVVLVAPDYQMLADVQRVASSLVDDGDAPVSLADLSDLALN